MSRIMPIEINSCMECPYFSPGLRLDSNMAYSSKCNMLQAKRGHEWPIYNTLEIDLNCPLEAAQKEGV